MKTDVSHILRHMVLLIVLISIQSPLSAQEFELSNYKMRFNFSTFKDTANNRQLKVVYLAANKKDRKDRIPITGADIKFYQSANDSLILIGETKTSNDGIAELTVPSTMELIADEEGYLNFVAKFDGSESLKRQKRSVEVKDLMLDLNISEIDSVQMAVLNAYTLDSLGNKIAVDELDVVFSVGGMLSRMPIEDASLEDGSYEFEMPIDLPGDVNGNFKLYAFVDDHDDFATVLTSVNSDLGVFDDIRQPEKYKLWTEAAPIWMYVVLTILLVGVWANYVYTIVKLRKIKKIG